MKLFNKEIGMGRALIIAEIGINHNGKIDLAKRLIDVAVEAGVDVVKFQKRNLASLYRQDVIDDANKEGQGMYQLINTLKDVELSEDAHKELFNYCKDKGVSYLCTPWDKESVDFLDNLGVSAFKIASADLTNIPLLKHIISKNKPIILSTGMSTEQELNYVVKFLMMSKAEFCLMHCNSTYPAPFYDLNLSYIKVMKDKYKVPVGYSGHERGILMSSVAVAMGADIIERHITLDRTMPGPDHAASIEPQGFARMIMDIRNVEQAIRLTAKKMTIGEGVKRTELGKSIVAAVNIAKGDIITEAMLAAKSPGKGLSPINISTIVGNVAKRDIMKDTNLREGDY